MPNPAWLFNTTWIYHITSLENLRSILEHGQIYASNGKPCDHHCIANEEIQARRARKLVTISPGGTLHDYVPFYFAPRSPMLFVNSIGRIPNAKPQEEIIHLVSHAELIHVQGLPYVFYDRHAVIDYAQPFNSIAHLDKIDWELFFELPHKGDYAQYWQDRYDAQKPKWTTRKEVRQAEFLIHRAAPFGCITSVGVKTPTIAQRIGEIFDEFHVTIPVDIKSEWYY